MASTPISSSEEKIERLFKAQVIGATKNLAVAEFSEHLSPQDNPRVYRTWFNIRLLSRLENLFKDGIESAGGLFEIICVFLVAMVIIGFVLLSQLVIFSIVVLVMAIFSGGASLKFFRTTYFETPLSNINNSGIEEFVIEMLRHGSLVSVESDDSTILQGAITRRSNRITRLYLYGINTSQFVAMLFALVEIAHYALFRIWLVDVFILVAFGLIFLLGIIILDIGVIMRHRLVKKIQHKQ